MYLPRGQIAQLYTALVRTTHPLSPPVLILTALTVDALCATRILTALLKRDYIPHKVQPISGYADLQQAGQDLVLPLTRQRGADGGVVVCLGVGALVDLEEVLGLDGGQGDEREDMHNHGVEVWVVDARRPWNLQNLFGSGASPNASEIEGNEPVTANAVQQGKLLSTYRAGKGGIIVWDDGDVESELSTERDAFMELQNMPDIDEQDVSWDATAQNGEEDDDEEPNSSQSRKRKLSIEQSESEDDSDQERPRRRRRSNSNTPIPSSPGGNPTSAQITSSPSSSLAANTVIPSSPPKPPSQRELRRKLLKLRRKHESTLEAYYNLGTSYAEPVSSMLYSLASELGREDNDLLWLAIVGISAVDLSPFTTQISPSSGNRRLPDKSEQMKEVLRDEVRRLNPVPESELRRPSSASDGIMPTYARSPTDTAIRLSPEPRFLLIRHWSLYDSMLHSPFLSTRLHVWSDAGRKRLNKLLAKMGISLQEAGKCFVHMDMEIKRTLRARFLKFAEMYNLEGLVPGDDGRTGQAGWGFVRSWGWKATLSAVDVAMVVAAILEVGTEPAGGGWDMKYDSQRGNPNYNTRVRTLPTPPHSEDGSSSQIDPPPSSESPDWTTSRFFAAYDALNPTTTSSRQGLSVLLANIPVAQHLHRAILRTGSALVAKKQIRHLRAFKMGVVKEGPDVPLFTHPGALTKLASWVSEAVAVLEAEKGRSRKRAADEALVLGCLDETRGVYVVVGLGGGAAGKGRVKTRAEIKEREDKRKRKEAARAAKKAEKTRKREERRQLQREIREANGLFDSDEEGEDDSDATESSGDESSSGSDDSESDEELAEARKKRGYGLNKFGQAFQEVVAETAARVRIDSFEHSVVEVRKEDLAGFLEALSLKSVIG